MALARAAALAAAVLCWAAWPSAALAEEESRELEELRGAIEDTRDRVGSAERQERALLEEIDAMDREADRLRQAVRRARAQVRETRAVRAEAEAEADAAAVRLSRTRRAMRTRVVALYKSGSVGPVRLLFSAASLQDLVARVSVLTQLVDRDADLVTRFRSDRDAASAARTRAAEAAAESEKAALQLRRRSIALEATRGQRRTLLASVRRDRSRERALLIELERAARALETTLGQLGEEHGEAGAIGDDFARLRGALPPPVDAEIVEGFGRRVDAEFLTETFHKGVEFGADAGEYVLAVATGAVRFAGWFRGYGRIVILDHGSGYFSVSGHLDELFVAVGDRVEAGDTLGTVGDTGSLSGPRLYFEIRAGKDPVDPTRWLDLRARG